MNPFPMLRAELRALGWTAIAILVLVSLASAIGIAINTGERALRKSSAAAADDFPLLIGAPGSPTQLVMTTIFLQPEALPLMAGEILPRLKADSRVRDIAPVAFGDIAMGYPIVGTSRDFALRWGRLTPVEGRAFELPSRALTTKPEALVGADVRLSMGAEITPAHALAGMPHTPGEAEPEEAEHRHEGMTYRIIGRLPRTGSPWDRAILVPIEAVWATHGLHADNGQMPGVPALVVRPKSVADAYGLRGTYRQGGTMAFFPAEVLVALYGAMGEARTLLLAASLLNAVLMFGAILLLFWAIAGLRRQRYAVLRALGAPRRFILLLVWLQAVVLIGGGCLIGLPAGWALTAVAGRWMLGETGLALVLSPDASDILVVAILIGAASLLALIPALLAYRQPVIAGLAK